MRRGHRASAGSGDQGACFNAELDRVGASYSKAGAADCVSLMFRSDGVK
jgi:hypothetical protein